MTEFFENPQTTDINDSEFMCERCNDVSDLANSHRVGEELWCGACYLEALDEVAAARGS